MVAIFGFLLWRGMADNPLLSFSDALRKTVETTTALQILFVIELLRQSHYLLSEHSSRWHHFVTVSVFGRWDRFVERRDPWTRYRFGRLAKLALIVFIIGLVLGALWDMPFYEALFDAPGRIGRTLFGTAQGLPLIFQLILYPMLLIGQFEAPVHRSLSKWRIGVSRQSASAVVRYFTTAARTSWPSRTISAHTARVSPTSRLTGWRPPSSSG